MFSFIFWSSFTTNTVQIRCKQNENNGSIKNHYLSKHGMRPDSELILSNMKILKEGKKEYLILYEALHILKEKPIINLQNNNFSRTLKII